MDQYTHGKNAFMWEVDAPDFGKVPDETDLLDSTIIMITASFKNQKFFRCSYLIRHFYQEQELIDNPPDFINYDKLMREIRMEQPIITLYELAWETNNVFM